MENVMEELRNMLCKIIEEKGISSNEALVLSQRMDKLIIDYYKKKVIQYFMNDGT
jgi:hypothetical protein